MLNNLLLIKQYVLCISNFKDQLNGVYIKGNIYRIDNIIEVSDETIEEFKTKRENITDEISNGRYFTALYDYMTNSFIAEIREKAYRGPYNEEITYNTIYKSGNSENLYLALNNLEKDILINKKDNLSKNKQKLKKQS